MTSEICEGMAAVSQGTANRVVGGKGISQQEPTGALPPYVGNTERASSSLEKDKVSASKTHQNLFLSLFFIDDDKI